MTAVTLALIVAVVIGTTVTHGFVVGILAIVGPASVLAVTPASSR